MKFKIIIINIDKNAKINEDNNQINPDQKLKLTTSKENNK